MKYKEEYNCFPTTVSGYLSPILETQGRPDPAAGAGRETPCPLRWSDIHQGLSLPPLHGKTPTSIPQFCLKKGLCEA